MSATTDAPKLKPEALPHTAGAHKQPKTGAPRHRRWLIGGIVLAAIVIWLGFFLVHAYHYEDTDDAYVSGHIHQISPQIDGRVVEVLVNDNQTVKAGDVLIKLDTLEYEIALQKARAEVQQADAQKAEATAATRQAEAQLAEAQAKAAQANAVVRQTGAQLELARQNEIRNQKLFQRTNEVIAKSEFDTVRTALDTAQAVHDAAEANFKAANASIKSSEASAAAAEAQQSAAEAMAAAGEAAVREAQRKLGHTVITAPADGRIGNKNVEVGNRVEAGQTLLAFVEPNLWVVANFKETQLARLHPGELVELTFDAVPHHTFHGTVDSLAPASGAQFALLPADNATGNFTKIVQRVPVKIVLDADTLQTLGDHLRPGLSTIVNVRVR